MRILLFVLAFCLALLFQPTTSTQSKDAPSDQTQTKQTACRTRDDLSSEDFGSVMQTIQDGWMEGNARKSADCFTEDAVYSSPPSRAHQGRENLYQHFGGAKGPAVPMKVVWHHLVFDSTRQLGMGEYTFQYHLQTHGVVVVKFSHGLISNWREYDVPSDVSWDKFVGPNNF